MSIENKHIANLIVGAMGIDGELCIADRNKAISALEAMHMHELVADLGQAIENDCGDFDLYKESRELVEVLGKDSTSKLASIYKVICKVLSSDRFLSVQEATYLSALRKRFKLEVPEAQNILKEVLGAKRGRIEISAEQIEMHQGLKELLSFDGAEEIVGAHCENSIEEQLLSAKDTYNTTLDYSIEDVHSALNKLALPKTASLDEAKQEWMKVVDNTDLKAMAKLGESFVLASASKVKEATEAYQFVAKVRTYLEEKAVAKNEVANLEKKIERDQQSDTRDNLELRVESQLTGVGSHLED